MMNRSKIFSTIKQMCPPIVLDMIKKNHGYFIKAQWEYVPEGFDTNQETKGWNLQSLVNTQLSKWGSFTQKVTSEGALGVNHESSDMTYTYDIVTHNTLLTYAYALLLTAQNKKRINVLDWGGGIGHYGVISEELLKTTNTELVYHCYDLSLFCDAGAKLNSHYNYFSHTDYLIGKQFDLVLASSSLWYEKDWKSILRLLSTSTKEYLYVTRMIFINKKDSYVAIQRPNLLGYKTEYLCWVINQNELLDFVKSLGFTLVREVYIGPSFPIFKAPEQGNYKGFLFKKHELT